MRRVTEKEMAAVWRLDGAARFGRFIKAVADAERAWGLWDDGWAVLEDSQGNKVLPLWPEREYADAFRGSSWSAYVSKEIRLDSLLNDLLVRLQNERIRVEVFPTLEGKGFTQDARYVAEALREELKNYDD